MPYGHVESDIYQSAKSKTSFENIVLGYEGSTIKDSKQIIGNIGEDIKNKIDNQISQLKLINS